MNYMLLTLLMWPIYYPYNPLINETYMKNKNNNLEDLSIKELTYQLQDKIDRHMDAFMDYRAQIKVMTDQIEHLEKNMFFIVTELEPVESLIYTQNPQLEKIFESLKRIYGKDSNGIDTEISK